MHDIQIEAQFRDIFGMMSQTNDHLAKITGQQPT